MIPDALALVVAHLNAEPAVTDLVGERISDLAPDSLADPWVTAQLLDAPQDPRAPFDYLVAFMLQFDCYAGRSGTQVEANLLGRIVRASLNEMPFKSHDGAVVTSVRHPSFRSLPDTDFEPARDRFILTSIVVAHPA